MKPVNVKLVFQLSLFGLAMALGTVFLVPAKIEPIFWLAIFVTCAIVIAKKCTERHFLHGLTVSLANCVWITTAHIALFETYLAGHPQEAAMAAQMGSPRLMMLVTGPVIGLISGLVLGSFAWIASKMVKPATA
ncbi:MAG TPA: hypothetical protein VIF62_07635 [Labilithrix sp.]|jgi:hypothetical protein